MEKEAKPKEPRAQGRKERTRGKKRQEANCKAAEYWRDVRDSAVASRAATGGKKSKEEKNMQLCMNPKMMAPKETLLKSKPKQKPKANIPALPRETKKEFGVTECRVEKEVKPTGPRKKGRNRCWATQ